MRVRARADSDREHEDSRPGGLAWPAQVLPQPGSVRDGLAVEPGHRSARGPGSEQHKQRLRTDLVWGRASDALSRGRRVSFLRKPAPTVTEVSGPSPVRDPVIRCSTSCWRRSESVMCGRHVRGCHDLWRRSGECHNPARPRLGRFTLTTSSAVSSSRGAGPALAAAALAPHPCRAAIKEEGRRQGGASCSG